MDFSKIKFIFKDKDLRNKILFVLAMMVVFRIAANIPIPGIDKTKLEQFFAQNQFFGLLNVFTGGALQNFSIVMLGLGPYITAIIIFQVLTLVVPSLKELYQEQGEVGRKKFENYARIAAVPLAAIQAFGMLKMFQSQGVLPALTPLSLLTSIITITAGSMFLVWIGDLITEKGIGNGVSLLIFAGIIAGVPSSIGQLYINWDPSNLPSLILFFMASLIIIFGVVIVNEARRNIPISYAKRVKGRRVYGGVSTYLPMMINPAGVIPIIFALSIMLLPGMLANFFGNSSIAFLAKTANVINSLFQNQLIYGCFYFILVVAFTYFYTSVTFDPKNVAENLQKSGAFIPGIRPGESTELFIKKILNRILFIGAIFLGLIAVLPSIIQGITGITSFSFAVGGTSLLILVSVILETSKQIQSQLEMREYE
ncbi:MAG: preprotein translocase subunit SecY [Candidatus Pacebacteria bacterium]|nr:preprotein translocase subunit SecY [Candidatus Paceibacterota bacterium]